MSVRNAAAPCGRTVVCYGAGMAMWVFGVTGLLVVTALSALALHRSYDRRAPPPHSWDLGALAAAYASIIGPLAGLSVASTIFLANLDLAEPSRVLDDVVALFLLGFIILVGTGILFATLRGRWGTTPGEVDAMLAATGYLFANVGFFMGVNITWLGLRPLLLSLGMPTVAAVISWLLAFAILSGASRSAAWLKALLGLDRSPLTIPAVAVTLAAGYRLLAVTLVPGLWPTTDAVLALGIVAFLVAAASFAWETATLGIPTRPGTGGAALVPWLRRAALVHVHLAIVALTLLWFAVTTV
jgi:hypothetical protein